MPPFKPLPESGTNLPRKPARVPAVPAVPVSDEGEGVESAGGRDACDEMAVADDVEVFTP